MTTIKKDISKSTVRTGKKAVVVKKVKPATFVVKKDAVKKIPMTAVKRVFSPPGMVETAGGIFVPSKMVKPIPASKLRKGFETAKAEIKGMIDEVASILTSEYNIKEIELEVSFNADGKFMGFGVGGAASIKIKIAPT